MVELSLGNTTDALSVCGACMPSLMRLVLCLHAITQLMLSALSKLNTWHANTGQSLGGAACVRYKRVRLLHMCCRRQEWSRLHSGIPGWGGQVSQVQDHL
jgi:hypothetical protein